MKNIAQALNIIKVLGELYPNAGCGLLFDTPFELLVATILSAQCTDDRVNQVTQSLFAKYRTPKDFARMSYDEFENHIKSCGLFRNKAKNIIDCAREIIEKYEGNVPQDIEHLQRMRGVGRK
ncbi:MAG: endonuclease III, partial [bacterium]|nr:endonuclease III [bacterium]